MKKNSLFTYFIVLLSLVGFYACNKDNAYNEPVGGLLPTHYITVKDSTFSPEIITEANGSSFTFLNGTGSSHTIMSDDSVTFRTSTIAPDSSFRIKPDTATTIPVLIFIPYHCIEHPAARGTIILTQ